MVPVIALLGLELERMPIKEEGAMTPPLVRGVFPPPVDSYKESYLALFPIWEMWEERRGREEETSGGIGAIVFPIEPAPPSFLHGRQRQPPPLEKGRQGRRRQREDGDRMRKERTSESERHLSRSPCSRPVPTRVVLDEADPHLLPTSRDGCGGSGWLVSHGTLGGERRRGKLVLDDDGAGGGRI